jgi:hypothetical protein
MVPTHCGLICLPVDCQMVYFQTKIPNLGVFGRVLQLKLLVHFIAIGLFDGHFGILCCHLLHFIAIGLFDGHFGILCCHLLHFVAIWYILLILIENERVQIRPYIYLTIGTS